MGEAMRHTTTVHSRAVERAARALGGAQELANYLRTPVTTVNAWMTGAAPVPGDVFLKIVDLLVDRSMTDLQSMAQESWDLENPPADPS